MKVRVVSVDYASDSGLDGTFVYARSSAELDVVAGRCRPGPCGEWWTFGEPNAILGGRAALCSSAARRIRIWLVGCSPATSAMDVFAGSSTRPMLAGRCFDFRDAPRVLTVSCARPCPIA